MVPQEATRKITVTKRYCFPVVGIIRKVTVMVVEATIQFDFQVVYGARFISKYETPLQRI